MKLVQNFDNEIVTLEEKANKLSAYKWAVIPKTDASDACFSGRSFMITCEEIERCDYMLDACAYCEVQKILDECYNVIRITSLHQDPRLNPRAINWNQIGAKIDSVFEKAPGAADKLDWRKFAVVARGYMLYVLSVLLTEEMLRDMDADRFHETDLMRGYSDGQYDKNRLKEVQNKIDELLLKITAAGHSDDSTRFDQMTKTLGESPSGNELECTRYWGRGENEEYHCFEYQNQTATLGTFNGFLFTGRKRIVFDPLVSDFVSQLQYDALERDYQRIADLGVTVGNIHRFPTRRIRSENRINLWNEFARWPDCTDSESQKVCRLDQKFRCTVPEPAVTNLRRSENSATNIATMNARITQIEMIW